MEVSAISDGPTSRGKAGGPGGHDHGYPNRHVLYCIVAATVLYSTSRWRKIAKRASRHPGLPFGPSRLRSQLRAPFAVQPFAGDAP